MMRVLFVSPVVLACAACVQPVAGPERRETEPVRVSNGGQPFAMWEGAAAGKTADAACGGRVNVSIYDRFDRATGEWVYPEGCA
jgi:hypothetical protein